MAKQFSSTDSTLWTSVSQDYEDNSFHAKGAHYPSNSFRYEVVLDFLEKIPKGKVLDAGCGPGLMTRLLQKRGWDAIAVDYSQGMLETARKKALEEGLPDVYQHLSLRELSKLDTKFDVIILNGVLPYLSLKEEREAFAEIKRVLKVGGLLIASHYNLYFDIFGFDRWSAEAIVEQILKPAGLAENELKKAKSKITLQLKSSKVLDNEKTMKLEDPLSYKLKLRNFGFEEFDQAYYNFFYLPARFEKEQNPKIREGLERKLRRDPKGLLLARGFVSFAKFGG